MTIPTSRNDWILAALERYERPLVSYVVRLCGDLESARDIVQDTFLKLCDQDRSHVEGRLAEWLYTVCRNAAVDLKRKQSRTSGEPCEMEQFEGNGPRPSARLEQEEQVCALRDSLTKLTPREQEVLRLRFQHELSYKEISAATQQSTSHVGFLIHTALQKLRSKMSRQAVHGHSPSTSRNGAVPQ
jgi:RNA polymerase sigma-70 factor (ECF subfamily)